MDRYDDVIDDEQDPQDSDSGEGDEQDPEFDEAQRAYLEREAQKRVAAAETAHQAALAAAEERHRQALVDLAARSGQQPAQAQQAAAVDPYEALGERPDPGYEPEAARDWDRRYREVMRAEMRAELAREFQPVVARQSQMLANAQMAQVTQAVERFNPYIKEALGHPDFQTEMLAAMEGSDPQYWDTPQKLASLASMVTANLDHSKTQQRQQPQRTRAEDGRFQAQAQRAALGQITAPRDSGRVAESDAGGDAVERELAAMSGMTLAEWRACSDPTGAQIRRERERKAARQR